MQKPQRRLPRIAIAALIAITACSSIAMADDHDQTGRWIMDYGRAYGLSVTEPTEADALYLLIWMKAATAVSPGLSDAWLWQYDLLSRLGREDEALDALRAYCRTEPGDLSAALQLIELELDQRQTAEKRIEFCRQQLAIGSLAPEVASDLHRRLAELLAARGNVEEATENARQAIDLFPENLPARYLLAKLEDRLSDFAVHVGLLVRQIEADPFAVEPIADLAGVLDAAARHKASLQWYQAAIDQFSRLYPTRQVPPDLLLALAEACYGNGEDEQALELCKRILEAQPDHPDATMLLIHAARRLGRTDVADQYADTMYKRLRDVENDAIRNRDAGMCMVIAWFHIDIQPDPQRALRFAELAAEFAPEDPLTQRVLGWAHLLIGETDAAIRVLRPLADSDQWSALGLARALLSRGDKEAAVKALRSGEKLAYSGRPYLRIVAMLRDQGEEPAPKPDRQPILDALAKLDKRVLEFPLKPAEAIDFQVTVDPLALAYAAPIWGHFVLANKAPYPITLGTDQMIDANVSVSLRNEKTDDAGLIDYLTVSLDRRFVVAPGQKVEFHRRLDTAAARLLLDHEPQNRLPLKFSFVLSPMSNEEGEIESSLRGVFPVSDDVTRLAVDAGNEGLLTLATHVRSGSEQQRMQAIKTVLALILERQASFEQKRFQYAARAVDHRQLTSLLIAALRDTAPVVRARVIWALSMLPLDDEIISAVSPCITADDWLVRLWATELFAQKQGPLFQPVLDNLSHDPNHLVASLARLYLSRAEQIGKKPAPSPTPQPRTQPSTAPASLPPETP